VPDQRSRELEALLFVDDARRWLDHVVLGNVGVREGVHAAQLLLTRAERLVQAT
jgi:hypothetical protein